MSASGRRFMGDEAAHDALMVHLSGRNCFLFVKIFLQLQVSRMSFSTVPQITTREEQGKDDKVIEMVKIMHEVANLSIRTIQQMRMCTSCGQLKNYYV